jgi:predicted  nucleic acid-binding Zn-ribbon protein
MLTELDALHDKLQAVQAVLESLRQENLRLRTQLSASEQQVQSMAQRIEQASSRLDTLLKQSHHG